MQNVLVGILPSTKMQKVLVGMLVLLSTKCYK